MTVSQLPKKKSFRKSEWQADMPRHATICRKACLGCTWPGNAASLAPVNRAVQPPKLRLRLPSSVEEEKVPSRYVAAVILDACRFVAVGSAAEIDVLSRLAPRIPHLLFSFWGK